MSDACGDVWVSDVCGGVWVGMARVGAVARHVAVLCVLHLGGGVVGRCACGACPPGYIKKRVIDRRYSLTF